MTSKLTKFLQLPPSRKFQRIYFAYRKMLTQWLFRRILIACGERSIVLKCLYWTPEYISLGRDVLIWSGCRIEGINCYDQTLYSPNIYIGDGVSIQQNCHITAASNIVIGKNTLIMFGVLITDIDHRYDLIESLMTTQPLKVSATTIGNNCLIGSGAKIQAGTSLGKHCVVGANSVVRGNFPDYCVLVGVPARIVKRFDPSKNIWRKTDKCGMFIGE